MRDVTESKLHISGCVETHRNEEKFGYSYELPNDAYLETCAGVELVFWGIEMFRMTTDASVWETVEATLHNVIRIVLQGNHFETEINRIFENDLYLCLRIQRLSGKTKSKTGTE